MGDWCAGGAWESTLPRPGLRRWHLLPSRDAPGPAYALHVDSGGRLWTGSLLASYYLDGRWTTLPEPLALQYAYTESPDGTLWAATSEGIYRKSPGEGFRLADAPRPRARLIAMSALTDSRGHVWFGGYESGLYRHDGKAWLHLDSTRGLPDDTAYGLLEDAQQRLWISHGRGLYTLSLAEADRLAAEPQSRAEVREYGTADGLPVDGFNGGSGLAAVRDQAGMLWFASDAGAVRLDPARLPEAIDPPQAVLDAIRVDDQPRPMTDADRPWPPAPRTWHSPSPPRRPVSPSALPCVSGWSRCSREWTFGRPRTRH